MLHGSSPRLALVAIALSAIAAVPAAGQVINENAKLLPADGAEGDTFGQSVAISGTTAVVGALFDGDNGGSSGSAYLFDTTTGLQLFKLLPTDGASGDTFGQSVAISGTTALVGANLDQDNGGRSGSAYLFDTTTGLQLFKLLPSDGAFEDQFGWSVAISGTTAVVGAPFDDDNGGNSGSAYLFDTTTGLQLVKLLPSDGAEGDQFGVSVAISGTTAVVGAFGDDDNGSFSGSAYLFDTTTGLQIAKLLPNDGAAVDFFGVSVAISGTTAVVGAFGDGDNGSFSGSAYLFDTTTGQQIAKLLPSDGAANDQFGFTVAISGTTAVVGAYQDDDNSDDSGSAYLFDATTGQQIAKLLPSDGAVSVQFGNSVAISGTTAVVGAWKDDDNGNLSGSAYVFDPFADTDGDGLLDDWEVNGVPYTGLDGTSRRFVLPGANPRRKNLYVEFDTMPECPFPAEGRAMIERAFLEAPVGNPDGSTGIDLLLVIDDFAVPSQAVADTTGNQFPPTCAVDKGNFFGTAEERADPDAGPLLEAKLRAFRYGLGYRKASSGVGGLGELGGNDFVTFAEGFTDLQYAAVLMHELGHNLNLGHGGRDDVNRKVNYPSIMNYALTYRYQWNMQFWRLDFSREELATVDESSLDETVSVGFGGSGFYASWRIPYYGTAPVDTPCYDFGGIPEIYYATLAPAEDTDFNLDCDTFDTGVQADLNFDAGDANQTPSPGEVMHGANDWAIIVLPISDGAGAFAGEVPDDEATDDDIAYIEANYEQPDDLCSGDWNKDGYVDTRDILAFLNDWTMQEYWVDLNLDGVVDTRDVLAFLNKWVAGC